MALDYDVIVIGGGPGGYTAAIRAAQLGLHTAVVERAELGGTCLNRGCMPVKAMLRAARFARDLRAAGEIGFDVTGVTFDVHKLVAYRDAVSQTLSLGVDALLARHNVTVLRGTGRLAGPQSVQVREGADGGDGRARQLTARHVILATGTRPGSFPNVAANGETIWDYVQALSPARLPARLIIYGSQGLTFASIYADLGSDVTLAVPTPTLLPYLDDELMGALADSLRDRGVTVHTSAALGPVETAGGSVTMTVTGPGGTEHMDGDTLIIVPNTIPNTDDIGLEVAGVATEPPYVKVTEWGQTSVESIYAIGDIAGPPGTAAKAFREGVLTAEHIAGVRGIRPLDKPWLPAYTSTWPIAISIGMTEPQARQAGRPVHVGFAPFEVIGSSVADGQTTGYVKTIADDATGELLGAQALGAVAEEIMPALSVLRHLEGTDQDFAAVVMAHPSSAEALYEAVMAGLGKPLGQ